MNLMDISRISQADALVRLGAELAHEALKSTDDIVLYSKSIRIVMADRSWTPKGLVIRSMDREAGYDLSVDRQQNIRYRQNSWPLGPGSTHQDSIELERILDTSGLRASVLDVNAHYGKACVGAAIAAATKFAKKNSNIVMDAIYGAHPEVAVAMVAVDKSQHMWAKADNLHANLSIRGPAAYYAAKLCYVLKVSARFHINALADSIGMCLAKKTPTPTDANAVDDALKAMQDLFQKSCDASDAVEVKRSTGKAMQNLFQESCDASDTVEVKRSTGDERALQEAIMHDEDCNIEHAKSEAWWNEIYTHHRMRTEKGTSK